MYLFSITPKERFEKIIFNFFYTIFKSRIVICYERDRFYFVSNDMLKSKIIENKKQKLHIIIPIFVAFSLIVFSILQNNIFVQLVLSIVALLLFTISFFVKKTTYTLLVNENKIDYYKFELDLKFKNIDGITFYKLI
jgi:hypothetical protein